MIIFNGRKYLDIEETAKMLGCSKQTIRLKVRAKEMPAPTKFPAYTFWEESKIEEYLKNSRQCE